MKRYILSITCLVVLLMSGCKKFLEESSQNLLKPTNVSDLSQTLLGEGYPLQTGFHSYLDLITDDVTSYFYQNDLHIGLLSRWSTVFLWSKTMDTDMKLSGINGGDSYSAYYSKIKGCNVVLDFLDKVDGSLGEKNKVKAEALFLRSFYYLNLVNLYGKPWGASGSNPDLDLGVPLVLKSDVTSAALERATVEQVYKQIEQDLLQAHGLFQNEAQSSYRPGKLAAALLLSRVYIYLHQWDKSINFANQVLAEKSSLKDLNELPADLPSGFNSPSPNYQISNPLISPEVIWGYGSYIDYENDPLGISPVALVKSPFYVSETLANSYADNDRRKILYYNWIGALEGSNVSWVQSYGLKYNPSTTATVKAFRVAEAYLNRTEAYIQKAKSGDVNAAALALTDLNTLRKKRITSSAYTPISISDIPQLQQFYQEERRRELAFEDQRWFDIRRWDLSVTHTLQLTANTPQTIRLDPGSNNFTLPIPQSAILANPNLAQNP